MANELMTREMVYQLTTGEEMRLTMGMVKKYLVSGRAEFVTEQEIMYFMHECKARQLNPFLRECWLIKYSPKDNAQIVESIHHKRNRARRHPDCQGWSKGVLIEKDGQIIQHPFPIIPEGAKLVGGWFEATPKGWKEPYQHHVSLASVVKKKRDGSLTSFWTYEKQPQQVMKVAESQGLSALWGDEIGNTVIPEEVGAIESDDDPIKQPEPVYYEKPPIPTPGPVVDRPQNRLSEDENFARQGEKPDSTPETPIDPFLDDRFDPAAQVSETVPNWWDNSLNWKNRKQMPMLMLTLMGRGQALVPFELPQPDGSTISIDDQYADLMRNLSKQNPGAVLSLDGAHNEKKKEVCGKLVTVLGLSDDDAFELVFGDISAYVNAHPPVPAPDSIEVDDQGRELQNEPPDDMPIGGKDGPRNPMADGPHPDDVDDFPTPFVVPEITSDITDQRRLVAQNIKDNFSPEVIRQGFEICGMSAWPASLTDMATLLDTCREVADGGKF